MSEEHRGRSSRRAALLAAGGGIALVAVVGLVLVLVSGDGEEGGARGAYQRHPAASPRPDTQLPEYALADPEVAELYRFALARPDVLTYIPCTCACDAAGHHSNWNCYVRSIDEDGTVVFDDMAPT